jgi:putative transposase
MMRPPLPTISPQFRITHHDRVVIGTRAFHGRECNHLGIVLQPEDGGPDEAFTHDQFATTASRRDFRFYRDFHKPREKLTRLVAPVQSLADLSEKERSDVLLKELVAQTFLKLEAEGKLTRSSATGGEAADLVNQEVERITKERARALATLSSPETPRGFKRKVRGGKHKGQPEDVGYCWRTILKIVNSYERFGLVGLARHYAKSGNRDRRLQPEVLQIMGELVDRYASEMRPTKKATYDLFKAEVSARNKELGLVGQGAIVPVSRKIFYREIQKIPAFEVYAARHGIEAAKRKFVMVSRGPDVTRPLEVVEMDEWSVQLHTLLINLKVWKRLTPEQQAAVPRTRIWLYAGICVATKCIVALRLARTPSAQDAVAAISMIGVDKTEIAKAAGAQTPWDYYSGLEQVRHDAGASYVDDDVRSAIVDLGGAPFFPPSGNPSARGTIERVFRTIETGLHSFLTGRTFSNVKEKGDYESQNRASLTMEEYARAIVLYIVDVYHNRPHHGLGGQTPRNAWLELTKKYGLIPPPDTHQRRSIFGLKIERTLGERGIRFLGLHYQSHGIQEHRRKVGNVKLPVKVDPYDLGMISVMINGVWLEAQCTRDDFNGCRLETWLLTLADLRRRNVDAAKISEQVVHDAIKSIDALSQAAILRARLGPTRPTAHQIERSEGLLKVGFSLPEGREQDETDQAPDLFADVIPVTGPPTSSSQASPQATKNRAVTADSKRSKAGIGEKFKIGR